MHSTVVISRVPFLVFSLLVKFFFVYLLYRVYLRYCKFKAVKSLTWEPSVATRTWALR